MKEFYICDCARLENQTITSLFVVAVKQVKTKKSGELYLSLILADRTGQLQANMWDNVNDTISAFEQDDFVKVKGIIHKYNGRWQLTVHKMRKLGESEIDYSRLPSQDAEGHRPAVADRLRLRRQLRESLAEGAAERIHGRRGHRCRVQECARGQDPASRLCRRTAGPCGIAIHRCATWCNAIIPRSIAICC